MQLVILLAAAFLMGAITPIYLPMNSSVARYLSSPILANTTFFFMALVTSLIALAITMRMELTVDSLAAIAKLRSVPVYLYLSGVFSALLVLGTTILIPRLGASNFFVVFVLGQVVMAVVVSHFGILESPQNPISLQKIVGIIFLMTGVALTTFSTFKGFNWFPTVFQSLRANFWGT